MTKFAVLIETKPFCAFDHTPMEQLKKSGMECIDMRGAGLETPGFIDTLTNVDAILCGNDLRIDDDLLALAPKITAIAKLGVGLDTVDIDAATRHNAVVFHTPGANNQAVADHTFALILNLSRKILYCDRSLREKRWEYTKIIGLEIWQKTIGIIGLGAIGRCVAERAEGFKMKVVGYDPLWPDDFAREHGIKKLLLEDLLKISDVITIHTPLIPETKGLIDKKALKLMKPTALLINVARGGIVKENDLYNALKNNVITGAGIDVFENEPPGDSPLLELDNVLLTPHSAAFTYEGLNNMSVSITEQLIDYYNGQKPIHIVNPEVYKPYRK